MFFEKVWTCTVVTILASRDKSATSRRLSRWRAVTSWWLCKNVSWQCSFVTVSVTVMSLWRHDIAMTSWHCRDVTVMSSWHPGMSWWHVMMSWRKLCDVMVEIFTRYFSTFLYIWTYLPLQVNLLACETTFQHLHLYFHAYFDDFFIVGFHVNFDRSGAVTSSWWFAVIMKFQDVMVKKKVSFHNQAGPALTGPVVPLEQFLIPDLNFSAWTTRVFWIDWSALMPMNNAASDCIECVHLSHIVPAFWQFEEIRWIGKVVCRTETWRHCN